MTKIDLAFSLLGSQPIAVDHGYHLYAGLSRALPAVHQENGIGVHPIRGAQIGNRQLSLTEQSRIVLRTDTDRIADLLPLAGKQINIGGVNARVGVPEVRSLIPTTALRSRLVTTRNCEDQLRFEQELRRQLAHCGASEQVLVAIAKRLTLRVKDKEVVGYEVILEGLTAEESLNLQEQGLGGRRHMGCGVFVAWERRKGEGYE